MQATIGDGRKAENRMWNCRVVSFFQRNHQPSQQQSATLNSRVKVVKRRDMEDSGNLEVAPVAPKLPVDDDIQKLTRAFRERDSDALTEDGDLS